MLRVLALCSLLCLGSAVSVLKLPDGYSQKLKVVGAARNLLKDLLLDKEYNVFEGDLHYLVMLSVVYYPAYKVRYWKGCVPPVVEDLYKNSLTYDLPNVLLKPKNTVKKLEEVVDKAVVNLLPLSELAAKVCDGVSEYECNKLLQKLLESGNYPEAVEAALVLNDAANVSNLLLSRDKRLKEVAYSLDVLPYLLGNKSDAVELVKSLVKLLKKVLPDVKPTDHC